MWKCKEPRIAKTLLRKNKVKRLALWDIRSYYKNTIIKTTLYGHKDRQEKQMERNGEFITTCMHLWTIDF